MMDRDYMDDWELHEPPINKDWLKASAASLAKLNEVGTKVYNIGLADSKQIKVNKHNLLSNAGKSSNAETNLKKCAWGSNGSIPELLRKQQDRIHQNKKIRPSSAIVRNQTAPTKTRQRPHSAKEFSDEKIKRPPSGLGVKGMHRGLEERPPGGIGVGAGTGWAPPPGGILDMTGAEIDTVLNQVSQTQNGHSTGTSGLPPPPRGSPDFSRMLDSDTGNRTTFGDLVEGLLFEDSGGFLPSEIINMPPPEPIHVTMPTATLDSEDEDEIDDKSLRCMDFTQDKKRSKSKVSLSRNEGNLFEDDMEPWDDPLETDEDSIPEYDGRRRRSKVVTFNEEKNETALITPRSKTKGDFCDLNVSATKVQPTEKHSTFDNLEDYQLSKPQPSSQPNHQLPKPKYYPGRPELKHVKSRTDSGFAFSEVSSTKERSGSSKGKRLPNKKEEQSRSIPMVSVAYIDDLIPNDNCGLNEAVEKADKIKSKPKRASKKEDVETMISKVTLSDEEENKSELVGEHSKKTEVVWAPSGSQTTKYVSSGNRNYYELALDAKIAKNRLYQQGLLDETKKTKTVKTLEFGDGVVLEHKVVSSVDAPTHTKKEYVLPKEARPQSALKNKHQEQSTNMKVDKKESRVETKDGPDTLTSKTHAEKYEELTFDSIGFNHLSKNDYQYMEESLLKTTSTSSSRRSKSALRVSGDGRPHSRLAFADDQNVEKTQFLKDRIQTQQKKSQNPQSTERIINTGMEDGIYDDFENKKLKKPRAVSAPARNGPTFVNGKLVAGGTGRLSSPYTEQPMKVRPYSASVVSEMKKRQAGNGLTPPHHANIKINAKLSFREIQRNKSAVKALKKGRLGEAKTFSEDKYYANYTRPPPKKFVPALRVKKMAEKKIAEKIEKESKEPELIQIWTRKDDYEIETDGISDCKRLQDTLLEQGVPVTLDTLTRALLPPNECALRGNTYMTNTNPSLPSESSRLLSKPSVWCPDEYNRLQRAKKAAQRAEQSIREEENEERNRMYLMSFSPGSQRKSKKKSYKKKK